MRPGPLVCLLALTVGCGASNPPTGPEAPPTIATATTSTTGFRWIVATPESQGMCGSTLQLGCTKTLDDIWASISNPIHNTLRFVVTRNDRLVYNKGASIRYRAYSSNKGLLGGPTLVYAMSRCGVKLSDPASTWLGHGEGGRWNTESPWSEITVEHLASHTSGICDYGNTSTVCRDQNPTWQKDYDKGRGGGTTYAHPRDMFTIARTLSEQNREPALPPGSVFEYSNVGHALLNYAVQRACGRTLYDIYMNSIKQPGMGAVGGVAHIITDGGAVYDQATGLAKWNGVEGAAVLRLASRLGIWDNKNVEPVRYWNELTKVTDHLPAAAAVGWGPIYENNSLDRWTSPGHYRLSTETFGHGGNISTIFMADPLTSTIIVRQTEQNATGASYLTLNGCQPGWTGTAPICKAGTNWANNWGVPPSSQDYPTIAARVKVVEPLQEAFFFPPPFCRLTTAAGTPVSNVTDAYPTVAGASTINLEAEIAVDPREGTGSSEVDKVEFYKEGDKGVVTLVGQGTLVAGSSPARYTLGYSAGSHGAVGNVRTYFANCVAKSLKDPTKKVPSYSRPVRITRM